MTKAKFKFTPARVRDRHLARSKCAHCREQASTVQTGRRGLWSYTVSANVRGTSQVVFRDNTGGTATQIPANLFAQAERDAMIVDRMASAGHSFESSFSELVDRG